MLQLAENKPRRHTQIAKKSKNGFPPFRSFPAAPTAARIAGLKHTNRAANWSFARLDATLLSALPARDISRFLHARGEEVNDNDLGQASSNHQHRIGSLRHYSHLGRFKARRARSLKFRPGH